MTAKPLFFWHRIIRSFGSAFGASGGQSTWLVQQDGLKGHCRTPVTASSVRPCGAIRCPLLICFPSSPPAFEDQRACHRPVGQVRPTGSFQTSPKTAASKDRMRAQKGLIGPSLAAAHWLRPEEICWVCWPIPARSIPDSTLWDSVPPGPKIGGGDADRMQPIRETLKRDHAEGDLGREPINLQGVRWPESAMPR